MKINKIITLQFIMLIPLIVFCQKDVDKSNLSFYFSPSFEATFANYNNLNTVLRNNGIKSFGNYHSGIGVRLGMDYKKLSLFANIFRSFGIKESSNNSVSYTDIITTDIGLEYKMNLTKKHNVQLSVYGAVGQLFSNVELTKEVTTTNFNNTISQTGNLLVIDNISNYLSSGVGLYYIGNDFVKYNIKVGYRLNESQPWLFSTLENEIPSSPRDNLSGVVLGFGVNFNFSIFSKSNKE